MEIRIVDKYTNGRIKNVEIYKESEFCHLIDTVLKENLKKISLMDRICNNFSFFKNRVIGNLLWLFEKRLKDNKNKKKR